jgi:hypothetical protein
MTEGEVVEQLVEFTSVLLLGVSVLFTVVSAYVVALNYFIGEANLGARIASFAFLSLILAMLVSVMIGAQSTHEGLVARLREIDASGELTAAGRAVLHNADAAIDAFVRTCIWLGLGTTYVALAYLTFIHRWVPDVVRVALQSRKAA